MYLVVDIREGQIESISSGERRKVTTKRKANWNRVCGGDINIAGGPGREPTETLGDGTRRHEGMVW